MPHPHLEEILLSSFHISQCSLDQECRFGSVNDCRMRIIAAAARNSAEVVVRHSRSDSCRFLHLSRDSLLVPFASLLNDAAFTASTSQRVQVIHIRKWPSQFLAAHVLQLAAGSSQQNKHPSRANFV